MFTSVNHIPSILPGWKSFKATGIANFGKVVQLPKFGFNYIYNNVNSSYKSFTERQAKCSNSLSSELTAILFPNEFKTLRGNLTPIKDNSDNVAQFLKVTFAPANIVKLVVGFFQIACNYVKDHMEAHQEFKKTTDYKKIKQHYLLKEINDESASSVKTDSYIRYLIDQFAATLSDEQKSAASYTIDETAEVKTFNGDITAFIDHINDTKNGYVTDNKDFIENTVSYATLFRYNVGELCSGGLSDIQAVMLPNLLSNTINNVGLYAFIGGAIGSFIGFCSGGPAGAAVGLTIGTAVGMIVGLGLGLRLDINEQMKLYDANDWNGIKNGTTSIELLRVIRLGIQSFIKHVNDNLLDGLPGQLSRIILPADLKHTSSNALVCTFFGGALGAFFGPAGAIIGAFVGALIGGSSGYLLDIREERSGKYDADTWNEDTASYVGPKAINAMLDYAFHKLNDSGLIDMITTVIPGLGEASLDKVLKYALVGGVISGLFTPICPAAPVIGFIAGCVVGLLLGYEKDLSHEIDNIAKELKEFEFSLKDKDANDLMEIKNGKTVTKTKTFTDWIKEQKDKNPVLYNRWVGEDDEIDFEDLSKSDKKLADIVTFYKEMGYNARSFRVDSYRWQIGYMSGLLGSVTKSEKSAKPTYDAIRIVELVLDVAGVDKSILKTFKLVKKFSNPILMPILMLINAWSANENKKDAAANEKVGSDSLSDIKIETITIDETPIEEISGTFVTEILEENKKKLKKQNDQETKERKQTTVISQKNNKLKTQETKKTKVNLNSDTTTIKSTQVASVFQGTGAYTIIDTKTAQWDAAFRQEYLTTLRKQYELDKLSLNSTALTSKWNKIVDGLEELSIVFNQPAYKPTAVSGAYASSAVSSSYPITYTISRADILCSLLKRDDVIQLLLDGNLDVKKLLELIEAIMKLLDDKIQIKTTFPKFIEDEAEKIAQALKAAKIAKEVEQMIKVLGSFKAKIISKV